MGVLIIYIILAVVIIFCVYLCYNYYNSPTVTAATSSSAAQVPIKAGSSGSKVAGSSPKVGHCLFSCRISSKYSPLFIDYSYA